MYYDNIEKYKFVDIEDHTYIVTGLPKFRKLSDLRGNYIRVVYDGTPLDMLALLNGAPSELYWRIIAEINDVEDPMGIELGTVLYVPQGTGWMLV